MMWRRLQGLVRYLPQALRPPADAAFERNRFRALRLASRWRMTRRDSRPIPPGRGEIRLFVKVRNESLRLPYFFDYYFRLGVDRIFIVSNNSTDNTTELALGRERVHVFETQEPFTKYFCWIEALMDQFGKGHWCVIADADEFLRWPGSENSSLRVLTQYLEQQGHTALHALALDMFPGGPVSQARYDAGADPLEAFPFFDTQYRRVRVDYVNRRTGAPASGDAWVGGTRARVFGVDAYLSKVPLMKYGPGIALSEGHHLIVGDRPADISGVVLHFKYLPTFTDYVRQEAGRGQYSCGAGQYKAFARILDGTPGDDLSLHWDGACRYEDTGQLLDLGLLKTSQEFTSFMRSRGESGRLERWSERHERTIERQSLAL